MHVTLSRRLTMHRQSGAPKSIHCKPVVREQEKFLLTREMLVNDMKIIHSESNFTLQIIGALFIQKLHPRISIQDTDRYRTLLLPNVPASRPPSISNYRF